MVRPRYSWDELIPVEETYAAAEFLVSTWYLISRADPDNFTFRKHEPKLTELLAMNLKRLIANSGLTGFWQNEDQEPYPDEQNQIRRIKNDIKYLSNASSIRIELTFEFKKLTQSSLSTYRSDKGMRRFVDGNYAKKMPLAVMVGIIKDDPTVIADKLYKSLSIPAIRSELQMVHDSKGNYIRRPSDVLRDIAEFDTEHRRPSDKAPKNGTTTIAHILVTCPKQSYA